MRSRSRGLAERDDDLLDDDLEAVFSLADLEQSRVGMGRAGAGRRGLAHRSDVDDPHAGDGAIEGHVGAPTDDEIGGIVAEERGDLLVAHVVRERLERIGRRAVDEDELAAVVEREAVGGGQAGEAGEDQLAELGSNGGEAVEPRLLVIAARVNVAEVERGEGPIADALHADRAGLGEPPPGLEGLGPGEADVARDEEVGVATPLRGGQNGRESVGVAVNIRETEDQHAASIFGRAASRQGSTTWARRPMQISGAHHAHARSSTTDSLLPSRAVPMQRRTRIAALAQSIDPERATAASARLAPGLPRGSTAHAVAVLLSAAYPALAPTLEASPEIARALVDDGTLAARDRAGLAMRIGARVGDLDDVDRVRRELRRAARDERIRIALRELLPPALGGADVDVTARELSALADVTMEVALAEAITATTARFGPPLTSSGAPGRFVILGMGKLGGEELNAGSDIDLIYFYDTDDGAASEGASGPITLHDYGSRVARRLTATLEEVTEDGFVWRVDLRLRPEGRSGPLVNSLAAAERYYEDFGRLWERAALLRARPSAGDLAFGDELMAMLSPFIWRRRVDPRVAGEMIQLAQRSRSELSTHADRDLKLGPGGIREAEFFVQALQLVWGGKEPRVRARNTLDGLRRLRAKGFVTDREAQEIALGYIALRRAEHAVQVASGIQTHERPDEPAARTRLARALGFATPEAFEADIADHMARISARFLSLLPEGAESSSRFPSVLAALERSNVDAFIETLARAAGAIPEGAAPGSPVPDRWADTARDLLELARHPDALLGARSRESFPSLGETVIEAVLDAADPEQAARYLRVFFARVRHLGVYTKLLGDDPRAVRRLVEAFGASAFIGDALANNPELGDALLFAQRAPTPKEARTEVSESIKTELALAEIDDEEDREDSFVTGLRRAKSRVTIEVGLADLASEIDTREATATLSAIADASLDAAVRFALETSENEAPRGLAVLAMGKLGGGEIGYGSDLDVLFLFDPAAAPAGKDPDTYFARAARRVIRLISASHAAGPGYELDTRLRPRGARASS